MIYTSDIILPYLFKQIRTLFLLSSSKYDHLSFVHFVFKKN